MPTNIVTPSAAIRISVRAAVTGDGALNAGTPSDTASTPVIAVQPLANAVSSMKMLMLPVAYVGSGSTGGTGTMVPVAARTAPVTISESITPTNT